MPLENQTLGQPPRARPVPSGCSHSISPLRPTTTGSWELIFEPTTATSIPLRTNPELLEIAERLPPMQAERQRLENQVTDEASEEEKQP